MARFNGRIRKLAKDNDDFRRELVTNTHSQVVLMRLRPDEDIGEETHADIDQLFFIIKGEGEAIIDGVHQALEKGSLLVVPAGTRHNVVNTRNDGSLRLVTIYAPPAHAAGTVHATRADALAAKASEAAA